MGKGMSFDTYLTSNLLLDRKRAEAYFKEALEEGDLELLKMSVENLLKAGYESFTMNPKKSSEPTDIQLQQTRKEP